MHAYHPIYFGLWMSHFRSGEVHAVQGHGAREDHHSTCFVHDSEIVAQMTP